MAIHDGTIVVGVSPRISQERFAAVLRNHPSPAAGEAEASWEAVQAEGVDPLFALAIFHQESQFGTDGVCFEFDSKSPGNTRSSRTGVGVRFEAPPNGHFIRYPSWTEGWRDAAFRLVDPAYDYAMQHRRTIRPILELWAPEDDPNDPHGFNKTDRYVANVVRNMIAWGDQVACTPFPPPPFDGADKQIGDIVFHAAARTVQVAQDGLRCRQFALPTSCETREPLRQGETFQALYWVEGEDVNGQRRWWVSDSGSRIWAGGTVQQPGQPG
ncbi:MAG: N-acetylmuramoyl-L-alanine amidase, family 2 [Thermomicrobiales bacterium]|jgi:hypothetical protein|nr:N-acetylmuramoyl-L-alanine amidase, family 2 [Thermomicrobiales bacterium]